MAWKRTQSMRRLLAAIESGDIQLVERLIVKGAKVNGEHWHETPSSCAIRKNQTQILALLIRHGLDLRGGGDDAIEIPAINAARYGHVHILALLIRHGVDPRFADDELFAGAAFHNQPAVLKFLAATIFAPDRWRGKTFLDIQKEAEIVERNILKGLPDDPEEFKDVIRPARLVLFDAAMTCWEHVRPDPPKINISDIPAKGKAL
jgi:hypothetical protein